MSFERVKKLLSEQLNIKPETITEKSRVIEDLGADSLDVVEMLMVLEDEFNVTVSDEESMALKTVGDICSLIDSKTKTNNQQ